MFNNNPVIRNCRNTDTAIINGIKYNLLFDVPVGVYLYDSNWVYKSTFSMPNINYGIAVANSFYLFTDAGNNDRLIKTSFTSSTVLYSIGSGYRGLYYDSVGSRIIAANCDNNFVAIYDLNFGILGAPSISNCPHGVTVYNSKIYVALWNNGNVAVISNYIVEKTFSTVCPGSLSRISVDPFAYFALPCYNNNQVYIYYTDNMQYTNKSIGFASAVSDARLDTNNRLVLSGVTNVAIYN